MGGAAATAATSAAAAVQASELSVEIPPQPKPHDRTPRRPLNNYENDDDDDDDGEVDPFIERIERSGCAEHHYAVQDCMFENKDWRKCQNVVTSFRECVVQQQQQQ